jgi:hypothetical protein
LQYFSHLKDERQPCALLIRQGGPAAAGDSRDHRRFDDFDDIVAWSEHQLAFPARPPTQPHEQARSVLVWAMFYELGGGSLAWTARFHRH